MNLKIEKINKLVIMHYFDLTRSFVSLSFCTGKQQSFSQLLLLFIFVNAVYLFYIGHRKFNQTQFFYDQSDNSRTTPKPKVRDSKRTITWHNHAPVFQTMYIPGLWRNVHLSQTKFELVIQYSKSEESVKTRQSSSSLQQFTTIIQFFMRRVSTSHILIFE